MYTVLINKKSRNVVENKFFYVASKWSFIWGNLLLGVVRLRDIPKVGTENEVRAKVGKMNMWLIESLKGYISIILSQW